MRRFRFEWRISLFTAIFLPVMVSLGFWQLQRAEENRALLSKAAQKREQLPVAVDALPYDRISTDLQADLYEQWTCLPVALSGVWQKEYFLLENQTYQGRNGYHVLGVLRTDAGRIVLVNRGWISAPLSRSELPAVPEPIAGKVELAEIYASAGLRAESDLYAESGWPKRIGAAHLPGLSRETGSALEPFMLRLREGSPSALTAEWPVVNIAPGKNVAYAIQWFAMSLALAVLYLVFSFKYTPQQADEV